MSEPLQRKQIADGVWFSCLHDPKFMHNSISVTMILPLEQGKTSAAALVPYLLRMGSRRCPDMTELECRLSDLYGASFDADVTRHGEYQLLTLSIVGADDRFVLKPGEKISSGCAELLGEMLFEPNVTEEAFPEKMFRLEQQYLIDSIESEINDKRSYAITRCIQLMGEGRRFAVSKFGSVEEAQAVTPRTACRRYREIMDTARIEIFFSGCGSPEYAEKVFCGLYHQAVRHPAVHVPEPLVLRAESVRRVTEEMPMTQSKLVMGFRVGDITERTCRDAARLMTALLGGSTSSRLFTRVREKLGTCYYCSARINLQTGILTVDCGLDAANREQIENAVLGQIADLAAGNISAEELENVKLGYFSSLRSIGDSLGRMEGWYLTQLLRGELITPEQDIENLGAISAEQTAKAAAALTLDTVYFLQAGEEEHID